MILEVKCFSNEWGIDYNTLLESIDAFSTSEEKTIPFISDIVKSVDFSKALNKSAGNKLKHNINLNKKLPQRMLEIKKLYY